MFCMLNGGAAGHNFFGDGPKFDGQKKEWRFQKVKWLADKGFELCDHTLWHMKLSKYPDAVVQEQIARNAMGIDSAVPGYKIRTMALPYGLWPKNRQLAWQGSWTDPKTGRRTTTSSTRCSRCRAGRRAARTIRSSTRRASTESKQSATTSRGR